jgi:ATP-dependent DNA helicase RecG
MTIAELLKADEGKTLEFKLDLSSPRNLLKTLVAFANTAGGRIIIGVADKTREPVGIDNPLDEEERICNLIADSVGPRLVPNVEMTTVDGKTLLVIEVFLSNSRPHYLRSEGQETGVYVRLGSTNRQADRELIAELRRSVEGVAFDELTMPQLSMDDLAVDVIKRAFTGIRQIHEQTLLTLRLLVKDQGKIVPTRGGVLLFGRNRVSHFPDCWVQCGRFIGTDKARIFDHIELEEPLPVLVDSIMLFLKKHAMRGADFSEVRRRDVWSIPLEPLREAVINALVHADWSQRGGPVRVAFFDDRIEIENPGILPPGMTVEDMRQGVSKIRNPVIARVFRELKLIEQWGSGVPRIFRETAAAGFPEPYLVELGLRVRFVFPLAETIKVNSHAESAAQVTAQVQEELQPESRPELRPESQLGSQLAVKVVLLLAQGAAGKAELAQKLGHKTVSGELKKQIRRLLDLGWIEMTIPDKPNSRLQKYRLTEKGKHELEVEK